MRWRIRRIRPPNGCINLFVIKYLRFTTALQLCKPTLTMSANASFVISEPRRKNGLKPGQKHSGSFRKGDDPRRPAGTPLYDGRTVAQIARSHGPECVETLVKAMRDENAPWPTRCAAASAILDRGHGKPVSVIDMSVTTDRPVATLSTDELEQIIAEQKALPIIEGEYSTVSNTVPTNAEVVT